MRTHAGSADRLLDMKTTRTVRITVRGRLGERLAAAFDGMKLVRRDGVTDIVGEVVDEAQLHSRLTRIRDLGLELDSLSVVATDPADAKQKGATMSGLATRSNAPATGTANKKTMQRAIVDHYGGPDVIRVVEDDLPEPGPGEIRARVLASGVSFTDSQLREGTYLGVPTPPFTPGYEFVGVVDKVGPGVSRFSEGDRIASLTVWGANVEYACVLEDDAVPVPADLDPAEVCALPLTYMTAYQVIHREAKAKKGESMLVHGAAGRVGVAALELGALAGLRLYGTASATDREKVERLGAVAIDYRNEDFLERMRALPEKGVDVVLDGLGGPLSMPSFRALRHGGRLVVFGAYSTNRSVWKWTKWYATDVHVALRGLVSPSKKVRPYRVQKLRDGLQIIPKGNAKRSLLVGGGPRHPDRFGEDWDVLIELLREGKIRPVVAERIPLAEARRAHEMLEQAASTGKLVLVP